MSDTTKTRTPVSPSEKLSNLHAQREGALLKRQEIDANISTIDARIARLLHSNPDLRPASVTDSE